MAKNRLLPSSRIAEAEWIEDRMAPFASCVTAIVPAGFEAYVRIFHPATIRESNERIRWADVAAKSGRKMHSLAQFHAINRPPGSDADIAQRPWPGTLPPDLLTAVRGTLAAHTAGRQSCFFCFWEGYGWLDLDSGGSGSVVFTLDGCAETPTEGLAPSDSVVAPLRCDPAVKARVRLPHRDYLLFEGPLEGATAIRSPMSQSPNLFWPEDRIWCVASEIDLDCTFVGGTNELAESLLANAAFEAWRVSPDDPISYDSDTINI